MKNTYIYWPTAVLQHTVWLWKSEQRPTDEPANLSTAVRTCFGLTCWSTNSSSSARIQPKGTSSESGSGDSCHRIWGTRCRTCLSWMGWGWGWGTDNKGSWLTHMLLSPSSSYRLAVGAPAGGALPPGGKAIWILAVLAHSACRLLKASTFTVNEINVCFQKTL